MIRVQIDKNNAWVTQREKITMYSENYDAVQIELTLSDDWSGLSKIGVFRAGDIQIDLPVSTDIINIPVNSILVPNVHLFFGLYGLTTANGRVAIATTWADLGIIQPAADPTAAQNYGQPVPDLYDQVAALATAAAAAAQTAASGAHAGTASWSVDEDGHMIMSVTEGGTTIETDLGPVTAYGIVKDATPPYSGTYEDFQELLQANAIAAATLAQVQADLLTVSGTASTATNTANSAYDEAVLAGQSADAAQTAATAAQNAVASKQTRVKVRSVTLTAGSGPWQNLQASGVTTSNLVIWSPEPDSFDDAWEAGVRMTAQGTDKVSFAASEATSNDIEISLSIFDNPDTGA